MRTRTAVSAAAATACILVIGWQFGLQSSGAAATPSTIDSDAAGRMSPAFVDLSDGPGRGRGGPGRDGRDGDGPDAGAAAAQTQAQAQAQAQTQAPFTAAAAMDGTYVGPPVPYPRGSVSVAITVADGVITDVNTVITSQNPVSQNFNQRAETLLDNAVLSEQSSYITMISGSTYTSQAYTASLQAALDEATP